MVRFRSYFDLLDDRLVQKIIKCIPGHWKTGGWRCLSSCCRRLCCLVSAGLLDLAAAAVHLHTLQMGCCCNALTDKQHQSVCSPSCPFCEDMLV